MDPLTVRKSKPFGIFQNSKLSQQNKFIINIQQKAFKQAIPKRKKKAFKVITETRFINNESLDHSRHENIIFR